MPELTLERTLYRMLKHGRQDELHSALAEGVTAFDTLTLDELETILFQTLNADADACYFRQFCDNWRIWNMAIQVVR